MDNAEQINELLKRLDAQRDAYLESFKQVHELLAQNLAATASQSGREAFPSHKASIVEPRSPRESISQLTTDRPSIYNRKTSTGLQTLTASSNSRKTGDSEDEDDDEDLYVSAPLQPQKYDEESLRKHLQRYQWDLYGKRVLLSILERPNFLQQSPLITIRKGPADDRSHLSDYQVFDVGPDGAPLAVDCQQLEEQTSRAQAIWHAIKELNQPPKERLAVGRITILREPSPILMAAAHHTLQDVFNVDELFKYLVEHGGTTAHMHRAFDPDARKQRSFVFSFEYFTTVGEGCQPMQWQLVDSQEQRKARHIAITRCSSVVALALTGPPIRKIRNSDRRASNSHGYVYDPWSSWHVLNLQCNPDWHATMDVHDSTKHYVNGPEAFMVTLLGEYRDAQKRFEDIYKQITKLITPPLECIFDSSLRDKLLFEDGDFTYSRRYFWAYQTLGMMNDGIRSMIDSYEDTFTDEVWEGTHKTLWPLLEQESARNTYFKKKMASLRRKFDAEICNLRKLIDENTDRRDEILGLKEELYKGTSIQESRKSVENTEVTILQGHNIKLLTLVSIFFLPLTFVTSVFGMTNMPTERHYWAFGVVTVAVCVPFFVLIGSLNTTQGMHWWKRRTAVVFQTVGNFLKWMFSCGLRGTTATAEQDDDEDDADVRGYNQSSADDVLNHRSRRPSRVPSLTEKATSEDVCWRTDFKLETQDGRPELQRAPSSTLAKMWMKERKRAVSTQSNV